MDFNAGLPQILIGAALALVLFLIVRTVRMIGGFTGRIMRWLGRG